AGTAVSTNAASSQITEAAASTGYQKTLIREVRGAADVFSRQDIEYWVAGYNKEQSEVSKADRNNVRWAVKVDSRRIELTDGRTGELIRGERIILGIPDEWAGKRILVMACLDGFNERVSQETKVGPISQGTLIRMVEGSEEVLPEREVKYKVTRYNKDLHLVSADFRNSVKWAVKVGEKEPEVLNKTGEELTLKIDKNWAGKTIVVMPHINKYTDIVSVRTRVGKIGNIRVKLGEKHYNAVSKLFEDANSSITAIFRKFEKKLFVNRIDVDVKDVEYDYINKELNLNIEADKEGLDKYGEKVFEPYERTIHEIWHKIDHLAGPSPNTFFSKAYMNELIEAFKADFRSIIGADISVFVTGDSNEIENNKYREFTEKNDFVLLNSIINAVTKGKLMYGHDEKYWNEKTIPAEIFANIAAIEIANPSASKAMQNQFSNTMKVYCEMICDMQKKEMI
ncbi:MAG: hypothetical protein LBU83_05505, partial [Bacteroidales bacterium]|nr:hypothetical protein [Bacteroidales bacterium]